ncbi:MAG: Phosphatase YwpJ [Candidatus Nitrosopelagicus brevis]|nr:phosphoglycolate phosphatase [Thermoproteota archaeon]NMI84161.1 phosphoglycolate phosphatase [Candidatus Nitrosopelagicus brevis]GIT55291.1 MAG: phosphoglycolate phosphatase [Candidatus Nitrosopelagicus sp.]MEC8529512.1 phosphoglycolate phosphatase [Thermoproteota archaeon]MEC9087707.1 phosphoglycolate phosphatase [Thermoproteota archaeon]
MAKKVLAVDIDGTITLNGFGKIHLQALEKLRNLKNDGHHVIFVTGRSSIEAYFLSIFGGLTLLGVGENGGCITHGEIMTHKMIGDKNECQNAFSYLKKSLDESIKEKPVFPRLTEVVLDRTFDIKNAQAILDEEGFNVGLFDSGYAYHINSRGVDKGSGLIKALEMLNADLEDTIALGDSETDVPMFRTVKNNIAVNNSIPELKEIAKIVTTKNSGEGLLEGLSMISDQFL